MGNTLLTIIQEIEDLLLKIDEQEEQQKEAGHSWCATPDIQIKLNDLLTCIEKKDEKVDNIVLFSNSLDSKIEWLKKEKESIDALIKKHERIQDRLKSRVHFTMMLQGYQALEGKLKKILLMKHEYVEILAQNEIPESYMRIKTTIEVDKAKIKEDLKKGLDVQGAALGIRQSVQFK